SSRTYTWEGVPEFSGGEEIEYTITEVNVPTDYTCETTTVAAGGTITNVHTPSTIDVIVTKVWDDASDQDGLRPETLTLTMGDVPEGVDVPEPTVAKDGDTWTYTWAGMPENSFGNPIEYIITEENVPAGYTCETTTVAAGGTITNVHTPATIVIEITKVWDDAFAPDGMRPTPEEFAGMLTLSAEPTVTGIDGYAPAVTVDPDDPDAYIITYNGLPAYVNKTAVTYTVTESAIPGYTTAQASATDGGTITNVYAPTSVIVDPPVQKIFVGDEEQALYNQGDFTFTIEAAEWPDGLAAEDVPMPVNTSITNSPNYERSDKPGYYEFGEIEFTVPGTYVYTVSEAGSVEGVTNDSEPSKTLTFVVDDNGEGALIVTPDTDSVQLSFTNTYTPPGTFTVIKNWVGDTADVRPEGIDVTVVATVTLPDKPELQLEEDPAVVDETAESENDEDLTVPADETDPADPAEDETDVPQTEGAADEADVPQTEGAADEADVSQTEGAADEADVPQAADTADDDAAVELSMKRDENEEVQTEYTWEFRMTADEQTQDGVWEHMIELPRLPEGATITFTVTEGEVAGYTTEIEVNDEEMYAEITNTLVPTPDPATVTLTATKVLDGRELTAGEFSFQLQDAGGNVIETVTNAADGAVTFSTLEFAEAGKYSFTIVEVAGEEGGVTYDTQSFGVTVTVTDEGKSALTAEVSYENGNPVFRNTYVPAPTTASITARKVLTGRTLAANEFSVPLLDAEGNVIETVKNAADGSIAFSAITYDAAGEYNYTIVEVIPTEKEEGMTYDTHRYGVTVTVTDDGQGLLAAEVTYTSGTPVFSNIYVPAGPPTGDSSHGALFGVIALAAAAICVGAFAVSRRRAR
ncbi:MAG: Cna B-type domain-containing protein, partial [Lachnospiraceae bacterium]|nr:Cna B-type domain-containing protein [Lachnospiraceae bacterium]